MSDFDFSVATKSIVRSHHRCRVASARLRCRETPSGRLIVLSALAVLSVVGIGLLVWMVQPDQQAAAPPDGKPKATAGRVSSDLPGTNKAKQRRGERAY
jgi:hypothetical protein